MLALFPFPSLDLHFKDRLHRDRHPLLLSLAWFLTLFGIRLPALSILLGIQVACILDLLLGVSRASSLVDGSHLRTCCCVCQEFIIFHCCRCRPPSYGEPLFLLRGRRCSLWGLGTYLEVSCGWALFLL